MTVHGLRKYVTGRALNRALLFGEVGGRRVGADVSLLIYRFAQLCTVLEHQSGAVLGKVIAMLEA